MISKHIIVRGIVQGVGFRYYVNKQAQLFDINGWVMNTQDGSVEIVCQGTHDNIAQFLSAVKIGSSHSHVVSIEEYDVEVDAYTKFLIKN